MSDQHGHGHGHGRGHSSRPERSRSRLAHRITHWITPHSHDAADRVDDALRTSRLGLRTVGWSFGVLAVAALAQLGVVAVTGSVRCSGTSFTTPPTR